MLAVQLLEPQPLVGSMLRPNHPVISLPKSTSRTQRGYGKEYAPKARPISRRLAVASSPLEELEELGRSR